MKEKQGCPAYFQVKKLLTYKMSIEVVKTTCCFYLHFISIVNNPCPIAKKIFHILNNNILTVTIFQLYLNLRTK